MQSDTQLVQAALNGQRQAYSTLVKRYERAVRATAAAVLRDHHAAQDAAQETFVTAFEKLPSLRKGSVFGPWVLKIVRRQAIRMARQRRTFESLDSQVDPPAARSDGRLDEVSERLLSAVMRLPKHERVIVMLKYFDGHEVKVIAEITNRPVGTVTKRLSRARARLRKWLQEQEP
ncbi:MAG: RNA polymerase sigma factor [Planctomycetota bacterium]|nr:RNA polymerase sigma factor [Planctomycetota bacterium]